jgi:hypothetical protein
MADAGTQFEFKTVTTVRGLEAKPTAAMQADGWELVTQTPAPLLRTTLTFRRPKKKLPKYALPVASGVVLLLAVIIAIGAATEGKTRRRQRHRRRVRPPRARRRHRLPPSHRRL